MLLVFSLARFGFSMFSLDHSYLEPILLVRSYALFDSTPSILDLCRAGFQLFLRSTLHSDFVMSLMSCTRFGPTLLTSDFVQLELPIFSKSLQRLGLPSPIYGVSTLDFALLVLDFVPWMHWAQLNRPRDVLNLVGVLSFLVAIKVHESFGL